MNNSFYNYKKDGITQGLLAKFMNCREETKLFLQGYSPKSSSSPALIYGTITHAVLEKVYDDIRTSKRKTIPNSKDIATVVRQVERSYRKENPSLSNEGRNLLENALVVAESILPHYFRRWWKQDSAKIKWQQLEQEFRIPYKTKDGRTTYIRGKIDGVFANPRLWLFETKTKSMVNEGALMDTLSFELQVMLYLWALMTLYKKYPAGVLYNIIRKPGSERKANETLGAYGARLSSEIGSRLEFYFIRYEIMITPAEQQLFKLQLEGMVVDFMDWCEGKRPNYKNTAQCITKYGRCSYLNICSSQQFNLYEKRKTVFRELEGVL